MDDDEDMTGWWVVHNMDPESSKVSHYCSRTCLVQDMAAFEVPEGIPPA